MNVTMERQVPMAAATRLSPCRLHAVVDTCVLVVPVLAPDGFLTGWRLAVAHAAVIPA